MRDKKKSIVRERKQNVVRESKRSFVQDGKQSIVRGKKQLTVQDKRNRGSARQRNMQQSSMRPQQQNDHERGDPTVTMIRCGLGLKASILAHSVFEYSTSSQGNVSVAVPKHVSPVRKN